MAEPIILVHRAQVYPHAMPAKHGVALDVRLWRGDLVLSHAFVRGDSDMRPCGGPVTYAAEWLAADRANFGLRPTYAWHLHEDGVEEPLARLLAEFPEVRERSFVFGGSYPTMRHAACCGLAGAQRLSECEPPIVDFPGAQCWLDRWDWEHEVAYVLRGDPVTLAADEQRIRLPLHARLWAVSPELHVGHSPWAWLQHHWRVFFRLGVAGICTDHPVECERAYQQWRAEGAR